MESFSNYFPGIIKKFAESIGGTKSSFDVIKFARFQEIALKENQLSLCILIGYELGFELWTVLSEPELIFSKRNQGISSITQIPSRPDLTFALASLYQTAEFPQNSVQVFSVVQNQVIASMQTDQAIKDLQSNSSVLVVGMLSKISIYETKNFVQINTICVNSQEINFTLSNLYIAYVLPSTQDLKDETDIRITDVISKTMHSIAENGLMKIKNYMDPGQVSGYAGRIWVRNLSSGSMLCEIQAFNSPISVVRFSSSSHLLVVSPASGTTFHVYRINPPKDIKGEYKAKYFLMYKLHRGITPADIFDISISSDDRFVTVTSYRGTCHVYKINPYSDTLIYNQEVFCRVKLASFLDTSILARCHIQRTPKALEKSFSQFNELDSYEILTISYSGSFQKYSVLASPSEICHHSILRSKDFRELVYTQPLLSFPKNLKNQISRIEVMQKGWTPLVTSSQFSFFSTFDEYGESLNDEMRLIPFSEEKSVPSFTVHFENSTRLEDALNSPIPNTQLIRPELDCQFIESTIPTYQLYLAEHFSK